MYDGLWRPDRNPPPTPGGSPPPKPPVGSASSRETLDAYVSRGMLTSERQASGRESRFDPAEVARLAERTRSGGRAGRLDIVIDSALTLLDPAGKLWYRGWDAEAACREASFEDVAEWLWTGASRREDIAPSMPATRVLRRR